MKTELKDRTLWYDGTIEIDPDKIKDIILSGVPICKISAKYASDDVTKFNSLEDVKITIGKSTNEAFDLTWNIPYEYASLNVKQYLDECVALKSKIYKDRLEMEWRQIEKRNLIDLFRTIIFIVDTFKSTNSLWGVGRGSSCASLALFLIGLHKVDPIKFGIPYEEFFHD